MLRRLSVVSALVLVTCVVTGCLLFKPSAKKMTRRALRVNPQYDVIIVPGIQFVAPAWDRVLQMRLIWAKHLYDRGLAKHIITSGASVYTPYREAEIMKAYLVAMGVPKEDIETETRAEHSTENLWYGYQLAKKLGYTSIALASDPFQSKMLYRFARKRVGGKLKFLPVIFDTLRTLSHATPPIDYQSLEVKDFVPITKKYTRRQRFRGTMGKNIDFSATD